MSQVTGASERGGGRRDRQNRAVLPPSEPTAARALRFEQAIVTVALLAGFVFRVALVIPIVGVLLAAPLVAGSKANGFARAYDALFGRARPPRSGEETPIARFTRLVEVGLLAAGTVLVVFRASGFAWVFALPVAVITGVAATTGINLVAVAHDRGGRGAR